MRVLTSCVLTSIVSLSGGVFGNGLFDNGTGARSRGLAGADTAWMDSVLGAMHNNPATLDSVTNRFLELGGAGVMAYGDYRNSVDSDSLRRSFGGWPEAAIGMRLSPQWVVGLSFAPQTALEAE
jgi:hypothetical protein